MSFGLIFSFCGAFLCVTLAAAVVLRGRRSVANGFFAVGMIALAFQSVLVITLRHGGITQAVLDRESLLLVTNVLLAVIWLCFSLTYSRGNGREFLSRWRFVILGAAATPIILAAGFPSGLVRLIPADNSGEQWRVGLDFPGTLLNLLFLVVVVLMLMNLEKTFRTAVGTLRWRIKFVVLGLCVIFGSKIYICSQSLLYSQMSPGLGIIENLALVIGSLLIAVSYIRAGVVEVDVYPSQSFLYGSVAVILTGLYLVIVGVLARLVVAFGGDTSFPIKALLVMLGIVALAILLLSDRLRQRAQRFISRHLRRPLYDYRKVWLLFTEKAASASTPTSLCAATAELISETFNVLAVSIWLLEESLDHLHLAASTSIKSGDEENPPTDAAIEKPELFISSLVQNPHPLDLEKSREPWAEFLRAANPSTFRKGGDRICVPIAASERLIGVIILGDRVSAMPFTLEEMDLLRCIANHVAASLLGLQLSTELMHAREQEAFRTVSTFFAHDLKNAASSLSLMLQNLPQHFNDPDFREDVLRGLGKTVSHMNHLINRLSVFRQKPEIKPAAADLNSVVAGVLERWKPDPGIELVQNFQSLPHLRLDASHIQNVVTNLLLNARDALDGRGQIRIQTGQQNGWAVLIVSDNGCGISPEFIRQSLFRPFQTTKKNGTGIGMFQCKMIVEAHRGKIEVDSELGKGTTFRIRLPLTENMGSE